MQEKFQKMKEKRKMQENFLFCVGMPAVAGDMARDEMEKSFAFFKKAYCILGKSLVFCCKKKWRGKKWHCV
ncbi:MAG: hypothetical protein IKL99_01355 [Oscillospiraceae bacterium]|nr:hypothetical protein [Oscillospiraceae bacterium]